MAFFTFKVIFKYQMMYNSEIFNPNKAGLFESSFFQGVEGGQFDILRRTFIFQEELI